MALKAKNGSGWLDNGYRRYGGKGIPEHHLIAMRVLGRPLKKNEVVHHVNEVRNDNRPENLVICTRSYHATIHKRMRSFADCGDADGEKCCYCKRYDSKKNIHTLIRKNGHSYSYHHACRASYLREWRAR